MRLLGKSSWFYRFYTKGLWFRVRGYIVYIFALHMDIPHGKFMCLLKIFIRYLIWGNILGFLEMYKDSYVWLQNYVRESNTRRI